VTALRTGRPNPQHIPPARHARRHRTRRRRPYGVGTAGAYAGIAAWWSREQWRSELYADLHCEEVRVLRAQVGTRGPVSIRACHAPAIALSACADGRTGRNAMPGNTALTAMPGELDTDAADYWTKLAVATGYSVTTVQKAEQVLVARGWLVRIRTGKNWLTRAERRELNAGGSRARQRRNVWACTLPKLARSASPPAVPVDEAVDRLVDNSPPTRATDVGCDLPTTQRVSGSSSVPANKNPSVRAGPPLRGDHQPRKSSGSGPTRQISGPCDGPRISAGGSPGCGRSRISGSCRR
jgi:hypothetical protein